MSGGRLEGRRSSVGGFKRGVWPGLGWGVGWLGLYFRNRRSQEDSAISSISIDSSCLAKPLKIQRYPMLKFEFLSFISELNRLQSLKCFFFWKMEVVKNILPDFLMLMNSF